MESTDDGSLETDSVLHPRELIFGRVACSEYT